MSRGFGKTEATWRYFWVACYRPDVDDPDWMSVTVLDQRNRKQENTEAFNLVSLVMACCHTPDGSQLYETMMLFYSSPQLKDPEELSGDDILAHFENKPGPGFRTVETEKLQQQLRGKR